MIITILGLHHGQFAHLGWVVRRVSKPCEINPKRVLIRRRTCTNKYRPRCCNGKKHMPSTEMRKCIETRSFLSLAVLLCSRHGSKNRSKSSKIDHKMITKNATPGVAIGKNARRRKTCKNPSTRVHFCCSRCCFAHAMDAKFVQNRRKSSMATCHLSTVVPAARRANSKSIPG